MADYVVGSPSFFNEDAKFFKDVYIYGRLNYDFASFTDSLKFNNIEVLGTANFKGDVNFEENITVGILTVRKKLDVGIGGTILTTSTGNIGLGISNPRQRLDVIGNEIVSGNIGIGSIFPEQKLDVAGSVKIDSQIYDSLNDPGIIGSFLTKDAQGIKWTFFEPGFTEGIFVYNENVLVGVQSFRGLNLRTGRSAGISTDPIQSFTNPSNPNIADVYIYDYWDFDSSGNIYRMSNVGIQNNNPSSTLDITGTLHATGAVDFDLTLNVDGDTTLNATLDVDGVTTLNATLDVDGATTLNNTLDVDGATTLNNTLDVDGATTLNNTLDVDNDTTLNSTLDVDGATTLNSTLDVDGATTLNNTLDVDGATTLSNTLGVTSATTLNATLQVGPSGTVITTTEGGAVGIGTYTPEFDIDLAKDVKFRKGIIDTNNKVGYDTNFYQTPRSVLTQVGVDDAGQIIGGRFFDAANMIRLNLDFIANEAVGYITSTDYKNPAFTLTSGNYTSCKDDIKDILKAITVDITKGGNVQSVGAGRSYYNGNTLLYIADPTVKSASIAAIGAATTVARYVINNAPLLKSYQSGVSSIRQIRDLTLQDDPIVGVNTSPDGCSNVVSAIYTCASIVTTIINDGPDAVSVNNPDGKIIWAPPGADSRNLIWVSKYGNDDNGGKTEGDAKLTIGAAAEIAQPGDTITIRPGVYYENNPIGLRTDVGVSGQDLRLVTIVPQNTSKDIFHVRRGCLIENLNFACETGQSNPGGGALAFPPTIGDIVLGKSYSAVSGYTAPGPATEGPSGRWRSPYVRNCTNFMPLSIGMKINGDHATASTIGADLKCMVCDSFTQYNEAGIGVSLTNNAYAQLVSIFTINCDIAIYADTGGSCDLTNSNSSFGNFGLVAVGLGSTEFTGRVIRDTPAESDSVGLTSIFDGSGNSRRPYDGQALWFKINLDNYPDANGSGTISSPMERLASITVINSASAYTSSSPPSIIIQDFDGTFLPKGPQAIVAEVSANIDDATGKIVSIDVINSGRNYLSTQDIRVVIDGAVQSTSNYVANMEPIYFTVSESTQVISPTGITTTTFNEFIPYELFDDDEVELKRISRILTSSHSFEYVGAGTDINTATPQFGGVPIKENEVVATMGAQIPFTSTDQKGNFDIGSGLQINQVTSTISGRDFSRAIQAEVTPLILALR